MKWITREHVHVDRVACPWLITKFIDPDAEFLFFPPENVAAKAVELGAIPFDIEGCELGHHGEDVSFKSAIIATGSFPLRPPIEGLDSSRCVDSEGLLAVEEVPLAVAE